MFLDLCQHRRFYGFIVFLLRTFILVTCFSCLGQLQWLLLLLLLLLPQGKKKGENDKVSNLKNSISSNGQTNKITIHTNTIIFLSNLSPLAVQSWQCGVGVHQNFQGTKLHSELQRGVSHLQPVVQVHLLQ